MIELAIVLGVVISLISIEAFGLAAGGIIIPGYISLQLTSPDRIMGTLIIALTTFLLIKGISKFTFLFGRRQMVVALLLGTILSIVSHHYMVFNTEASTAEFSAVGWVVPGLIAHWAANQGFVKTMGMLSITSVVVRLAVIICFTGNQFPQLY
jgi:poly-gamma-glutamate biosynthesis protein PgsC/CapC